MKYKIFNEDCMLTTKKLKDNSIDLIVTDPPYGVNFLDSKLYNDSSDHVFSIYEKWLSEFCRILKDGSHIYIFIPTLEADKWITAVKKYFKFNNLIATNVYTTSRYLKNNFTFDLQLVIYASKGQAKRLNAVDFIPTSESWLKDKRNPNPKPYTYQYPSYFPKELRANRKPNAKFKAEHPNQKNVDLIEKFILLSSEENQVIYEPFMGSCSTGIATINTKRQFIGSELNTDFYQLSKSNLDKALEKIT